VTELKTGCTTDSIVQKDLDQLGGSVRLHPGAVLGVDALPVMVHPSRVLDPKAIAVPGMRVITPQKLEELKTAVAYAVALGDGPNRW